MEEYLQLLQRGLEMRIIRIPVILVFSLLVAVLVKFVVIRLVRIITRKTATDLDDQLLEAIRGPIFWSVLIIGISYITNEFEFDKRTTYIISGILKSTTVVIWGIAAMRIGSLALDVLSRLANLVTFIQPSTLPMFQILVKLVVAGGIAYFAFIAWGIDVTGWIASAGIVGIAVGFAAKDTLANLFAGIFILTDAPYKVGDFIVLGNSRGRVTHIGIRTTRVLTRDDIEITIPNANIANSQIINETAGRHEKRRLRIKVSAAYGCEPDQVREILQECVRDVKHVCATPAPSVRLTELGDSGLLYELRVWIEKPVYKGRVSDNLYTKIYNSFRKEGIEIPYTKREILIRNVDEDK